MELEPEAAKPTDQVVSADQDWEVGIHVQENTCRTVGKRSTELPCCTKICSGMSTCEMGID